MFVPWHQELLEQASHYNSCTWDCWEGRHGPSHISGSGCCSDPQRFHQGMVHKSEPFWQNGQHHMVGKTQKLHLKRFQKGTAHKSIQPEKTFQQDSRDTRCFQQEKWSHWGIVHRSGLLLQQSGQPHTCCNLHCLRLQKMCLAGTVSRVAC